MPLLLDDFVVCKAFDGRCHYNSTVLAESQYIVNHIPLTKIQLLKAIRLVHFSAKKGLLYFGFLSVQQPLKKCKKSFCFFQKVV